MLDVRPAKRPSAVQVLNSIRHADEGRFCGQCCSGEESTFSDNEDDSIVDDEDDGRNVISHVARDVGFKHEVTGGDTYCSVYRVPENLPESKGLSAWVERHLEGWKKVVPTDDVPVASYGETKYAHSLPLLGAHLNIPGAFPAPDREEDGFTCPDPISGAVIDGPMLNCDLDDYSDAFLGQSHPSTLLNTVYETAVDSARRPYNSQSWTLDQQLPYRQVIYETEDGTTTSENTIMLQPSNTFAIQDPIIVIADPTASPSTSASLHGGRAARTSRTAIGREDPTTNVDQLATMSWNPSSAAAAPSEAVEHSSASSAANTNEEDARASIAFLVADIGVPIPMTPPPTYDEVLGVSDRSVPESGTQRGATRVSAGSSFINQDVSELSASNPLIIIHQVSSPQSSISGSLPTAIARDVDAEIVTTERVNARRPARTRVSQQGRADASNPLLQHLRSSRQPSGVRLTASNLNRHNVALPPARFRLAAAESFREKVYHDTTSSVATSVVSDRTRTLYNRYGLAIAWQDRDNQFLEYETQKGRAGAVKMLLKARCNPGTCEKPRRTPVFNCIRGASVQHNKCLSKLIEYGVDVNVTTKGGKTPLMLAVEQEPWDGLKATVCILINNGADPNIADRSRDVPLLKILGGGSELSKPERDALAILLRNQRTNADVSPFGTRNKPLHLAIRRRDYLVVGMLLLKDDSVIEAKNVEGLTPLLLAVSLWSAGFTPDSLKILDALLEAGANVEAKLPGTDKPPLHVAISLGLVHAVVRLLESKANVGKIGMEGKSAADMVTERKRAHRCDDCVECDVIQTLVGNATGRRT